MSALDTAAAILSADARAVDPKLQELWELNVAAQQAHQQAILDGTATFEQGIAAVRANLAFANAIGEADREERRAAERQDRASTTEAAFREATESIRSAHAMLLGVINIGSFQHEQPDPDDLDATATLILDARDVLKQALERAAQ